VGLVDGKFVDEDVVAGTPGSLIPAQWGNAVTEELLNVITSVGLTPDEGNNAQLLAALTAIIAAAIPGSPPDATTLVKGLVELATNLETQTGTDTVRAVTPAGLASRTATEVRGGIIRLGTQTEVNTGTDDATAITPLKLTNKSQPSAYDTTAGKLMLTGAFGIGSTYANPPIIPTDLNGAQVTGTGVYRYNTSSSGRPTFGTGYGSVLHSSMAQDGSGNYATQIAIDYTSDSIGFRRTAGAGGWQPWVELFHKGNLLQATETIAGIAPVATQAKTNAVTDDVAFVTAKKLGNGMSMVKAANGYLVLPSWLGGFILQWGTTGVLTDSSAVTVTLPVTNPTATLQVFTSLNKNVQPDGGNVRSCGGVTISNSQISVSYNDTFGNSSAVNWLVIGY
jgi:hypothetical protein